MIINNSSDEEIERQLIKSLDKIPFEMKKLKVFLWVLKKINYIKKIFI
ncbi:MAG: hypothetical protein KA493_01460 [Fusobacteriaceae bacterium]|nr:hypothetical protein [Fusobacteriaceae bacterium]